MIGQIKSVENNERPILMFLWKLKNFKRRLIVMDVELEIQGISLEVYPRACPCFRRIVGHMMRLDQSRATKNIWWIITKIIPLSKTVNLQGKNEFTIISSHFIFAFLILHSLFHISYSISSILRLPFAFSNISFASHLKPALSGSWILLFLISRNIRRCYAGKLDAYLKRIWSG